MLPFYPQLHDCLRLKLLHSAQPPALFMCKQQAMGVLVAPMITVEL
jgi:hypothetical protein